MKELLIFNEDTGEAMYVEDARKVKMRVIDSTDGDMLSLNVGCEEDVSLSSLHHWNKSDKKKKKVRKVILREGYTEYGLYRKDGKWNQLYVEQPEFSKDSFELYWSRLCRHIERDTNIILKSKGYTSKKHAKTVMDLAKICNCSKSNMYDFLLEATQKNLIVKDLDNGYYLMNPDYIKNGYATADRTLDLFGLPDSNEHLQRMEERKKAIEKRNNRDDARD